MYTPSIKTLTTRLQLAKTDAKAIKEVWNMNKAQLLEHVANTERYQTVHRWINSCWHIPRIEDIQLEICNVILGGFGVETITPQENRFSLALDYVNMGDTYTSTITYFDGLWRVCSYGDIVERHYRLFS
jgi:hypothetical protein